MRSFAVIAGFAAAANAAAYGYAAESSSVAAYPAESSKAPVYPAYPAASSSAAYAVSSKTPEYPAYPASSSPAAYPVSSAAQYPVYSSAPAYTTTKVVTGLTTVCPEATTLTYGSKTYTVSKSTTLVDNDCEYTTTYVVKPTPSAVKTPLGSSAVVPSGYSSAAPPKVSSAAPYPSMSKPSNGTSVYPTGVKPSASSTKPATPEFTGAAGKATVGFLAIAAGVAALF